MPNMSTTTKMKYLYFISEEWRVLRGCTVHLIRRLTPVTKKHAPPSRVGILYIPPKKKPTIKCHKNHQHKTTVLDLHEIEISYCTTFLATNICCPPN